MTRDQELLRDIIRNDFASFAKRGIAELMPGLPLDWNWHHDLIADRLMRLAEGRINRLLINVPPRSLKSLLCSVMYPAWLFARNAAEQVLCVSYSQPLGEDFARRTRALMESRFYQVACDTRIARDRRAVEQFETTAGGRRITSSVHGTILGRGGTFIIIDDPMKPEDALSETGRKGAIDWLRNTLLSRADDKRDSRMLVIMQRLHQDDVAGYLLQQGEWETINLPAIAITQEEHHYAVAGRPVIARRQPGEALHAVREPLAVLERLRSEMSHVTFSAQYQQTPLPLEGNLVRRDWISHYEPAEIMNPDRVIQSWDTASKMGENCDYSVCTTWAVRGGVTYLLDVWRGRLEMPDLCRKVVDLASRFGPERVVVEDKGSGIGLIQALRAQRFHAVVPFVPRGEKLIRFGAIIPQFEGGHVRLPRQAPWLRDYIDEICGFPNTRHDDQVDSTSQALTYLDDPVVGSGFLEFYQRELGNNQ